MTVIMRKIIRLVSVGILLAVPWAIAQKKAENTNYYQKWLDEDVVYIITDEEKAVFQKLATDDERDQFIEQFWARRDTDPATIENEYKEEHYRRIQYVNQHYAAGIPGWKTDRGRVYIQFGPPDRLETHPAGGTYDRKATEGGGRTSTYPFEVWGYRHIEGVGDDIELEFVNDVGGNMYRLTMDPQQKDELLHVPGMGLTWAEMMDPQFNGQKSFDRVWGIRENGLRENQGIKFDSIRDNPFEQAVLLMNISKPPAIHFTDLKEKVTARVTYNLLPFHAVTHVLRVDSQTSLVPVTLSFDPHDISFKTESDLTRSSLQVYGLVTTLSGKTVYEFDDEITAEYPGQQMNSILQQPQVYQRKLALKPGKFKLDLIVKDTVSGKMGTIAVGVDVPAAGADSLSTSSIILTHGIERAEPDWSKPYVFGIYKIRPLVDRTFADGDDLGFYVEAYNFQIDQSTGKPALTVKYGFASPGKEPSSYRAVTAGLTLAKDRIYLARMVQVQGLAKGKHELVFVITDTLSGQSTTVRSPFEVR